MTDDEFDTLVRHLEEVSRTDPRGYENRVRRILLLGYAIPAGVTAFVLIGSAVLILLAVGGHSICALIPVLALMGTGVGIAIWAARLKIPDPVGVGLDRQRHATFFQVVDRIGARLRADPVHYILLTEDLNAGMAHIPRFGLFGGYRAFLLVGLPLLYATSPEELESILAHELGHLVSKDNRLSFAAYRLHQVWQRWGSVPVTNFGPVQNFLRWYIPQYAATTFVMRRAAEYVADRYAARTTTAESASLALIRSGLAGKFMNERVGRALFEIAKTEKLPPEGIYQALLDGLATAHESSHARRWVRAALAENPEHGDSHPTLAERLASLGTLDETERRLLDLNAPAIPPLGSTAAEAFLGDDLARLVELIEAGWRTDLTPAWKARRAELKSARATLKALDNQASYVRLSEAETWRRAILIAKLRDPKEALYDMRETLRRNPAETDIALVVGLTMLEAGEPDGIEILEKAMEQRPALVEDSCHAIADFLTSAGRHEEAEAYIRRAERHYFAARSALREREKFTATDTYAAHDFAGDKVCYFRERLSEVKEIVEAYLVQKVLVNFAQFKVYALAVVPDLGLSAGTKKRVLDDIGRKTKGFEHPLSLLLLDEKNAPLRVAISSAKGGRIYRRDRRI